MSDLPEGWCKTKFTEVFDVQGGTQPPKSTFIDMPTNGYIRLLQIRDFGSKPVPTYIPEKKTLKTCEKEDLLIARYGASLGRICTGMEGAYNVALAKLICPEEIDKAFAKYYLRSDQFQSPLRLLSRSAQNGFNKEDLADFDLSFPPLAEQTRIAQKLDELLAQVDTLKARIDSIPARLKRFRQSVLAAAVSGRLTEQDRTSAGWESPRSAVLGACADSLDPNPSHRYPSYEDGEVPILSTQDFSGYSGWDFSSAKLVNRSFYEERRAACGFQEGDVIFARKGRLGLARKAPAAREYVFSHTVFIVRAREGVSSDYLLWCLRPDSVVDWLMQEMNSNTGVPTLGKKVFEQLPILLPCESEQTEIVRRVEQLFAFADQLEAKVASAKSRIDHLTQSILAKAFRGELVPQDPNDEPASELLARIKAQRAATPKAKRGRKSA